LAIVFATAVPSGISPETAAFSYWKSPPRTDVKKFVPIRAAPVANGNVFPAAVLTSGNNRGAKVSSGSTALN
jgi:hypothetical protein